MINQNTKTCPTKIFTIFLKRISIFCEHMQIKDFIVIVGFPLKVLTKKTRKLLLNNSIINCH